MKKIDDLALLAFLALLFPSLAFALTLKGQAIQGGVLFGFAPEAKEVFFNDKQLPLSADGKFILGFGRDEAAQAILKIKTKSGTQEKKLLIQKRSYDIQAIDGIEETKVTPPAWAWAQIKKENQQKKSARKKETQHLGWQEKFFWPMSGQISGVYGSQRILNGKPRRPHYGVDIAGPAFTPVLAPASGTITLADENFYFEGGLIFLDHGFGLVSAFLHLGKILVRPGQRVAQGERIALSGSSGRSTGAHLDWRIKWRNKNIDPALLMGARPCPKGAFIFSAQTTCDETKANSPAAP